MKLALAFFLLAAGASQLCAADAQAGQAAYVKACKVCHGTQGEGNPAIAKALKVTIADLRSSDVQGKTDDELKKNVTEGTGKMKPVKNLSGSDLSNIVAFVRTLAKK